MNYLKKYITFSIFLITFSSVNQWTSLPIGNTFIWWAINSSILLALIIVKPIFYNKINDNEIIYIKAYLLWNIICIFRGFFKAENYWDWKQLISTSMVLLIPLIVNIATNKIIVQNILSVWVKYALPIFLILFPFFEGEAYGKYLFPISILILFFPIINWKWKIILVMFSSIVLLGSLEARSNVIKFAFPVIFSLIYYLRKLSIKKYLRIIYLTMLISPFILFITASIGVFNIFKMEEYLGEHTTQTTSKGTEINLTADSRTFLYEEVLESAIKYKYALFGITPARGNESETFGYIAQYDLKTGRNERYSNEVSILNIFTWTGCVGVILYFIIFFRATYLAINKSQNIFMSIIGLYIAFRWMIAWLEDFSTFNLSSVFLWIMISMCISKSFRNMSNNEFTIWIFGIFNKKFLPLNKN